MTIHVSPLAYCRKRPNQPLDLNDVDDYGTLDLLSFLTSSGMAPAAASLRRSTHVVLCVAIGKGHLNPGIIFAKRLALLGLSITVVLPYKYVQELLLQCGDPTDGLDIAFAALEVPGGDVLPPNWSRVMTIRREFQDAHVALSDAQFSDHEKAFGGLLKNLMESASPPVAVIYDMTATWTSATIRNYKLAKYTLYPSSAAFLAASIHIFDLHRQGKFPQAADAHITVPGIPPLKWHEVPGFFKDPSHGLHSRCKSWNDCMMDSDGILLNTIPELEGKALDGIDTKNSEGARISSLILPIGPILPASYFNGSSSTISKATIRSSTVLASDKESFCEDWLDMQRESSVVYISFGSWSLLSDEQIHELASGLEASAQQFLWVFPESSNSNLEEKLPSGFQERTKEQGILVRGWAPQHLILSHPSVGGFITHCGWNSVLECIYLSNNAPMLGWPFIADQLVNCKYLVEELKIAIDVHERAEDGLVERGEVERGVRELMQGPEAEAMRLRLKKVKEAMRSAASEGGSSDRTVKAFVRNIHKL